MNEAIKNSRGNQLKSAEAAILKFLTSRRD
jgi:hypothetical protein